MKTMNCRTVGAICQHNFAQGLLGRLTAVETARPTALHLKKVFRVLYGLFKTGQGFTADKSLYVRGTHFTSFFRRHPCIEKGRI